VALLRTDITEELSASITRVRRMGVVDRTLAVTSCSLKGMENISYILNDERSYLKGEVICINRYGSL
jgi:hypothetical protein